MATTEITDAAIRATATATAMAFRPIEGARPPEGPGWGRAFYEPSPFDVTPGPARRPVVHVGQEEAAAAEAAAVSAATPPPLPQPGTGLGRRRAETMPGGMIPLVDPQPPPPPAAAGVLPDQQHGNGSSNSSNSSASSSMVSGNSGSHLRVDLATIAGPSRVVMNEDGDDAVFGFATTTGDEIAMDLD